MKMRQDFEAGVRNLRKFKSALILLFIYLFIFLFLFFLKGKFAVFQMPATGVGGEWWTPVQKPTPASPTSSGARNFLNRSGSGPMPK